MPVACFYWIEISKKVYFVFRVFVRNFSPTKRAKFAVCSKNGTIFLKYEKKVC